MTDFGIRLRQAMEEKGMNASELSRLSGVGKNLISYYINGKYLGKQDKVYLLAQALGVDPGWLMTGVEPSPEIDPRQAIIIPDSEKFRKVVSNMSVEDYETVMAIYEKTYKKMKERGEID